MSCDIREVVADERDGRGIVSFSDTLPPAAYVAAPPDVAGSSWDFRRGV